MSHTESDFFCWGGGLKKAAACGFFGVLLWLLLLLVGLYVAAAPLLRSAALGFDVATLFNIILIIEQYLSTNSGR
jgi:hypothetical protein